MAKRKPASVPFFAHEQAIERQERHINKLYGIITLLIVLLFLTNLGWLAYESQFQTVTALQDGAGINNVNLGEQGDLNNGADHHY